MRSSSCSWLTVAAWFYLGPFVVIAGLALLALGFGVLAVGIQAFGALLRHAGV
jgi:hypothetical protein